MRFLSAEQLVASKLPNALPRSQLNGHPILSARRTGVSLPTAKNGMNNLFLAIPFSRTHFPLFALAKEPIQFG
jgi:hypothetical protein